MYFKNDFRLPRIFGGCQATANEGWRNSRTDQRLACLLRGCGSTVSYARNYIGWVLALALAVFGHSCLAQTRPRPSFPKTVKVEVYESTTDLQESLQQKEPLTFGDTRLPALTVSINPSKTYQQMEGFGASLTDSSAWLLFNKLDGPQRKEILQKLFDPVRGIGLSFIRQPMGASDFALSDYSYDDLPEGQTDPDLNQFSIAHDHAYIIPVLREALAINGRLKIVATPWSAPGWMKTSGSLIDGHLLPARYASFARYFVKFVQSYEAAGVPIYAVTMQNEPLYIPKDYPGMGMSSSEQMSFLRDHLGPAFRDAHLKTKIMVFDHNWNLIDYPITVLADPQAASFAVGTATHCYGGTPAAQEELHSRFPDKGIWLTECSGGDWQAGRILEEQTRLIISSTRHWAKSVVLWNLALDQDHGPHTGGCKNCRALVTVTDTVSPSTTAVTVDYVAEAHVSKFVVPGAYRIESNTFEHGSLEDVAFRNPDGSIVLLVLNSSNQAMSFNVGWQGRYFSSSLQEGSVATFVWHPPQTHHR
jgi:glucosylceramidase